MAKKKLPKRIKAEPADPNQDARVTRSKELVLKVTWELLSENGLGGVSVDEVSRRSGVAKTTIYRHWATRSDLLMEACSQINASQAVPDKGSLKKDLEALMKELAEMLRTARWANVLPSVVDSAERDESIAKLHGHLQRLHAAPFREVLTRGRERGELAKGADIAALTAATMGSLFYRRWFSREPIDEKFIRQILALVLGTASI